MEPNLPASPTIQHHAHVRADRAAAGLSGAAILVVLALAPGGSEWITWVLLLVAALVVLGTFAPVLPVLHRLLIVGSPSVELRLSFHELTSDVARQAVTMVRVGITNNGPGEIRRPLLNVLVPRPVDVEPCDAFGAREPVGRGKRMPDTSEHVMSGRESAFWVERLDDVDHGSALAHYRISCTEAGEWAVRVKLTSSSLYRKRDVIQNASFEIGPISTSWSRIGPID